MNENEKDFMNQLNNLDDISVEEIAENYPVLDENAKKRIVRKCMKKSGFSAGSDYDDGGEIVVSGTERYNRISWHKYTASAAAFLIAVVGIASVAMLHRNLNANDDFEIDQSPAVISDSSENDNSSEEATVTTKDKGYVAGGHDYANDSEYSGIIVGGATQTPPTVDESSSGYTAETDDNPVVNNNNNSSNNNTPVQPVTQAPATTPVTQAATAPLPETEPTATAPASTEPFTETVPSEPQKTFIEGRYFVAINNFEGEKYDGFEFSADGTIKQFVYNLPEGTFKRYTEETFGYEIIENKFSYGAIGDESNWKTGTIIEPGDSTGFSVQFYDSTYTFSTNTSGMLPVETSGFVLSGVWYGDSTYGIRKFEFYDDVSGSFNFITSGENINNGFEYKIENLRVYFNMNSGDVSEGSILHQYDGQTFSVLWDDGTIESFYSEQKWLEMNQ